MRTILTIASLLFLISLPSILALNVTSLDGTWQSTAAVVVTGPDFYDPIGERIIEPSLPGISFSFTVDGYYEEAIYNTIPNPTTPTCPQAIIIWQHGSYEFNSNGSITLNPIAVDGRQLWSDPCTQDVSIYTRYNQTELYSQWEIVQNTYRGQYQLNLYKFDGSPMNPMYLAYRPPQMLPTTTLNPLPTAAATATATATQGSKIKRAVAGFSTSIEPSTLDRWWYIALGTTILGGLAWYCV